MIQRAENTSDTYKLAYARGVHAGLDAVLSDLWERGDISDEQLDDCPGCVLAAANLPTASQRWDFAAEIIGQPPDPPQ